MKAFLSRLAQRRQTKTEDARAKLRSLVATFAANPEAVVDEITVDTVLDELRLSPDALEALVEKAREVVASELLGSGLDAARSRAKASGIAFSQHVQAHDEFLRQWKAEKDRLEGAMERARGECDAAEAAATKARVLRAQLDRELAGKGGSS